MSHAQRIAAGLALALLTPSSLALAFPPVGFWPLILVAYVPMVVAQHAVLPARWAPAAVFVGVGGTWTVHFSAGLADGDVAPVFQLLPLYVGAIAAALTVRSRSFHARTGYRWLPLTFPVLWAATDFLRSVGSEVMGATWGFKSYALAEHPSLIQPVSVFGIVGLELLLMIVNWSVATAVVARIAAPGAPAPPRRTVAAGLVASGVAAAAWTGTSVALLDEAAPTVRVAAVQTGVERGGARWEERYRRDVEQTRHAAERGARLVVWNEAGLQVDARDDVRTPALRTLAAETGAHLAIGYAFREGDVDHNEVTVISPGGRILGTYGKEHPGTFAGDHSDVRGPNPVYRTPIGAISTIICYDLDFTDSARSAVRNGARLIATPSADVPAIARTHWTHLVFRAVENRVSMVKADNEFDSVILDPWGRVLAKAVAPDGGLRATLVADVPVGTGRSPWVSWGDWFGWLTVAAGAVVLVASVRARYANSGASKGHGRARS